MNLNRYDLKAGDKAILDSDFVDSTEVDILYIAPNNIIALVEKDGESWQVLMDRLTPINI